MKYWAFMKSMTTSAGATSEDPHGRTSQWDAVTALASGLLGPKQRLIAAGRWALDPPTCTSRTHHGELHLVGSAILLGEIRCLEFRVAGNRLNLLELEFVHAGGDNERQEGQKHGREDLHGVGSSDAAAAPQLKPVYVIKYVINYFFIMTSTRRRVQQPLNTLESLLVAQIVWKNGDVQSTWSAMAKTLSKHPLVSRPKSFFTAQSCRNMYETLMKDANLTMYVAGISRFRC